MNNQPKTNEQQTGSPSPNVGNPRRSDQTPGQNAPGQDQQPGKAGESRQDTLKQTSEIERR